MQPVPEKPQQEQFLSMGTKRVLDEAELTDNENESRAADPIDMFKMPVSARHRSNLREPCVQLSKG